MQRMHVNAYIYVWELKTIKNPDSVCINILCA